MMGDEKQIDRSAKRPRRVTAKEVARAAGVSRTAVSRAFNPDSYLDAAKRERVLKTALDIGYRPNALAASLQGQRSGLIGIIAGDLNNYFDSEVLAALVGALNRSGKSPLVLGGPGASAEETLLSSLRYPLDAMIIRGGSIGPDVIASCEKLSIPVIYMGRMAQADRADSVTCNNRTGMSQAVNLLLERGRRAFGYIGGPQHWSSEVERFCAVSHRLGAVDLRLVASTNTDFTIGAGAQAAFDMLKSFEIDALICANDAIAVGALSTVRFKLGRSVPDDISIIGFDDMSLARLPEFNLTTIRNPVSYMVEELVRVLIERMHDTSKPPECAVVEPELVLRGTH